MEQTEGAQNGTAPAGSDLPDDFVRTVRDVHGEVGRRWLDGLPALLATWGQRWGLRLGAPFSLTYNFVTEAERDGELLVLKVGVPGDRELQQEMVALGVAAGHGMVRLVACEPQEGVLLMERITPGTSLSRLAEADDTAATAVAASVLQRLWRADMTGAGLPGLEGLAGGFARYRQTYTGGGPIPTELVARAESLWHHLCATASDRTFLHGDLHHDNVLWSAHRGWLAIDPKGYVGDPAYDAASVLLNPRAQLCQADLQELLPARVDALAARLDIDVLRLRQWGFAKAVISASWDVEDHGEVDGLAIQAALALRP